MAQELPEWLSSALAERKKAKMPDWLSGALEERKSANGPAMVETRKGRSLGFSETDEGFNLDYSTAPRGIRNNNPGNIETGSPWQGLASDEELLDVQRGEQRFAVFKSPEFGIRAMGKVLKTYKNKYGLNTVKGIINRWAPPTENDTNSYVEVVSEFLGVRPDERIDLSNPATLSSLISAIIKHENGEQPYPESIVMAGISLIDGENIGE